MLLLRDSPSLDDDDDAAAAVAAAADNDDDDSKVRILLPIDVVSAFASRIERKQ